MEVNLKLGMRHDLDVREREEDPMSRTWIGWSDLLDPQTIYEQNRGVWVLGARASAERYATFSYDGQVRIVIEIDHIEDIEPKSAAGSTKQAIVGRVVPESDPVHAQFAEAAVDSYRNPVTYIADPPGLERTCYCGCGAPMSGKRVFVAGHDQRAVHQRISRQWGSTVAFIDWFDSNFQDRSDADGALA